jgi:signal transduction histidine kinase
LYILRHCGGDADTWRWMEDVLDQETERMMRIVNDLLDLFRLGGGRLDVRGEPVELAGIVNRAIERLRPAFAQHEHQLELSLPEEPVVLVADPARLEQVLENLLSNAAKYTEAGGRIELAAAREDGEIVLRVRDNGIGIDQEELAQVFKPFWRSTRAPVHAGGGTGIGLALVRRVVELHGGSVSASSEGVGRGSEFVVRLPQSAGENNGSLHDVP